MQGTPNQISVLYKIRLERKLLFRGFQDCCQFGHLGYCKKNAIIVTMNLRVASIPPSKVSVKSNIKFGRRDDLNSFKMDTMVAIYDIEIQLFSTSRYPFCHGACKQVMVQPDT